MNDWFNTRSYSTIKELVKWNRECRQSEMNKMNKSEMNK